MTDRELAEVIWHKWKGQELNEDENAKDIIYRYWHRAMEKELGDD